MRIKYAHEQTQYKRTTYIQNSLLSPGIRLNELRDLVAATADYSPHSDVILEKKKITVIEHTGTKWREKGSRGMSEYTPTTKAVRTNYAMTMLRVGRKDIDPYSAFDRWLTEHDREVAAKALRDAAQDSHMGPVSYGWSASGIAGWLRARAEQIEEGTGE